MFKDVYAWPSDFIVLVTFYHHIQLEMRKPSKIVCNFGPRGLMEENTINSPIGKSKRGDRVRLIELTA